MRSYWVKSAPKAVVPKVMRSNSHKRQLSKRELWGIRIGSAIGAGLGAASFQEAYKHHKFENRHFAESAAYGFVGTGLTAGATLGYFAGRHLDRRAARKQS